MRRRRAAAAAEGSPPARDAAGAGGADLLRGRAGARHRSLRVDLQPEESDEPRSPRDAARGRAHDQGSSDRSASGRTWCCRSTRSTASRTPSTWSTRTCTTCPLQIAAERGLPALAVWLWFVVGLVVALAKQLRVKDARYSDRRGPGRRRIDARGGDVRIQLRGFRVPDALPDFGDPALRCNENAAGLNRLKRFKRFYGF